MEVIVNQILIMAILIASGYVFTKMGMLSEEVTRGISDLLLRIIIPLTIINSFIKPFSLTELNELLIISLLTIVITVVLIYIARFAFKDDQVIEQYASIFSNKGFIGIPIVSAVFGPEAISLVTPIIVISNVFAWTYGMSLLYQEKMTFNIQKLLLNPSVIALGIGLLVFICPFEFPYFIVQSVKYLNNINTPMAMIVIGSYLAKEDMRLILSNKLGYKVSLLRLLIMPLIVLGIVYLLPLDNLLKSVLVVGFAVPSAANTAMFAQITGGNYSYGAQIVCLTTILSAFTLPIILLFIEWMI